MEVCNRVSKGTRNKSFTIDSDPNAKGYYLKMGAQLIGETPSTVFKGRLLPL